ncbi:hypothetical protein ACFFHJ_39015 [Planotetraspora thailandica]|nr:hypothetical protein [Planotetraspora thailandica]
MEDGRIDGHVDLPARQRHRRSDSFIVLPGNFATNAPTASPLPGTKAAT